MRKAWSLLAVAVSAMIGVVGIGSAHADSNTDAARDAACVFARSLVNYDYRNLDSYNAHILTMTTGPLRTQLAQAQSTFKQAMISSHVHSVPSNVLCAVQSVDRNTVRVLVGDQQIITSVRTHEQPETQTTGMIITEQNTGGRWLASSLQNI